MNYIKSLHIEGFKKFQILDVEFNEHMNILVGENEAGKSTILDAIKTALNQQYRLADKSVLRDLFNAQMVEAFLQISSCSFLYSLEDVSYSVGSILPYHNSSKIFIRHSPHRPVREE